MDKYRLLIVDDEEDIVEISKDAFDEAGHLVLTSTCPLKALSILESDPSFDIIISDARMPELDGIEFFYKVKELFGNQPPYFFLSTGDYTIDKELLKKYGMTDVIIKPYDIDRLVDFVIRNKALRVA